MGERRIVVAEPIASTGAGRFDRDYYDSRVAFMPDGGYSVVATYDEIIWSWNQINREWDYEEGPQKTILQSFSSDGQKLGPEQVLSSTTRGIAYDTDGDRLLSTADDQGVNILYFDAQTSVQTNILVAPFRNDRSYFSSHVAFRPDGSFSVIYTYEDDITERPISILQNYSEDGRRIGREEVVSDRTLGIAYDTDGDRLLSSTNGNEVTLRYFDAQTSTEMFISVDSSGKDFYRSDVDFLPNGNFSIIYTYEDDQSNLDLSVLQNFSENGQKIGPAQYITNMSQGISFDGSGNRLISTADGGSVSVLYRSDDLFTESSDTVNINLLTNSEIIMYKKTNEIYSSLSGSDNVILASKALIDRHNLTKYFFAGDGNDTITGQDGDDHIIGQKHDDSLTGGNGNDVLIGGHGNDTLVALDGPNTNDYLEGGIGRDTFLVDAGDEILSVEVGESVTFGSGALLGRTMFSYENGRLTTTVFDTNYRVTGQMTIIEGFSTTEIGNFSYGLGNAFTFTRIARPTAVTPAQAILIQPAEATQSLDAVVSGVLTNVAFAAVEDLVDYLLGKGVGAVDALVGGIASKAGQELRKLGYTVDGGDDLVGFSSDLRDIVIDATKNNLSAFDISGRLILALHDLINPAANTTSAIVTGTAKIGTAIFTEIMADVTEALFRPLIQLGNYLDQNGRLPESATSGSDFLIIDADTRFNTSGAGNDTVIISGSARASIAGGAGNDTVAVAGAGDRTIDLAASRITLPNGRNITVTEFENARGASGNDLLRGNGAANALTGDDGNDTLEGGSGADTLGGGDGMDFASYRSAAAGVRVSLALPSENTGIAVGDRFSRIEGLLGSNHGDVLVGDAAANTILGITGNDTLQGLRGGDRLIGGTGNDRLLGGAGDDLLQGDGGNDRFEGGDGFDTAVFSGAAAIRVNLAVATSQVTGQGSDLFFGIEGVSTGSGHDRISGDALANRLTGNAGNDLLQGGAGNDLLVGGTGNDTLHGGMGVDTIIYAGAAVVSINLSRATAQATGHGTDVITGVENITGGSANDVLTGSATANILNGALGNDRLFGAAGNDLLQGEAGNDVLEGGGGADRLVGGQDADRLTGSLGADIFIFRALSDSMVTVSTRDTITDFNAPQGDRIDLSALDANADIAGNQAFVFIGTLGFTGVAGQLNYRVAPTGIIIAADVDGDNRADFAIFIDDQVTLTDNSFYL